MNFGSVRDQAGAVSILKKSIAGGRVASSYLFIGMPGVGRKTTALAFAAALNCRELKDDACGSCSSCRALQNESHPDIRVWRKHKNKKEFTIDLVRELMASLMLKPYLGGWKVVIIDGADSMNWQAANAFLLTLEEPPPSSVIILVAENQHMLPETVVSRCQKIYFKPLCESAITEMLLSKGEAAEDEARLAAVMAEGSFAAASDFISEPWRKTLDRVMQIVESVVSDGEKSILDNAAAVSGRDEADRTMAVMEKIVRMSLFSELGFVPGTKLPGRMDHCLAALAGKLERSAYITVMESVGKAKKMLRGNVNPRLVIEGFLLEFCRALDRSGARLS